LQPLIARLAGDELTLEIRTDPDAGTVRADEAQLQQAVLNVVTNASEASEPGGQITVETARRDDAFVEIIVRDEGKGMDEEAVRHCLEPFFSSKPRSEGAGLGLAICHGILEQCGGEVTVESRQGRGTTVHLALPRLEEEAPPPDLVEASIRGAECILYVEDQAPVRLLVTQLLQEYGYEVIDAGSAEDALKALRFAEREPRLLLTDVVLPGMSGRDLADRLRREYEGLLILFLSGSAEEVRTGDEPQVEGVYRLQKPVTGETLGRKVRAIFDG
ncbi:MAG: ATP-binding protein, partial [Planctomycetota bacterium]